MIKFLPDRKTALKLVTTGMGWTFEEFRDFLDADWYNSQKGKAVKKLGTATDRFKRSRSTWQFNSSRTRLTIKNRSKKQAVMNGLKLKSIGEEAVKAGELTEVNVEYTRNQSCAPFLHGTSIILSELKDTWEKDSVRDLAYRGVVASTSFRFCLILSGRFKGPLSESILNQQSKITQKTFENQMEAVKSIWIARLVGKSIDGEVTLSLQFPGEQPTDS